MIGAKAEANLLARAAGAARERLGRPSLPVPIGFALLVGAGGGTITALAVLYLAQRGPGSAAFIPFALVLSGLDAALFAAALLAARSLVRRTYRPMLHTVRSLSEMTRERFAQAHPPRLQDPDSREIVTMLWHFGRTLTEQERGLQMELNRTVTDLRRWQQREAQARGLIDLIAEMSQALGLQAVLERLAHGISRFFAGDGVGIWVRSALGPDLQLAVQVGESYPAQLTARDQWLPGVLRGAPAQVRLAGSRVNQPSTAVPLQDARGTAIGVLVLTPTRRPDYTPAELDFLRSVIGHAALAVQNALAYDQTDALSRTDPLTGLQNRREVGRGIKQEVDPATRHPALPSPVMVGIDPFKQINDRRGHPAGDWALQRVAELMRVTRIRGSDAAFRIGGEEFAILLAETDKAGALTMAERLRQTIEGMRFFSDGAGVTVSLGVATFPVDARDGEELLRRADKALYEAKNAGRNLVIPA